MNLESHAALLMSAGFSFHSSYVPRGFYWRSGEVFSELFGTFAESVNDAANVGLEKPKEPQSAAEFLAQDWVAELREAGYYTAGRGYLGVGLFNGDQELGSFKTPFEAWEHARTLNSAGPRALTEDEAAKRKELADVGYGVVYDTGGTCQAANGTYWPAHYGKVLGSKSFDYPADAWREIFRIQALSSSELQGFPAPSRLKVLADSLRTALETATTCTAELESERRQAGYNVVQVCGGWAWVHEADGVSSTDYFIDEPRAWLGSAEFELTPKECEEEPERPFEQTIESLKKFGYVVVAWSPSARDNTMYYWVNNKFKARQTGESDLESLAWIEAAKFSESIDGADE